MIEIPRKIQPYVCHHVKFLRKVENEHIGRCPFCDRREHFYVNEESGQFSCKACGEQGNIYTFLKKYSEMLCKETRALDYQKLANLREIPSSILRDWKIGWDGECWILPVLSEKKTCHDIRRWNPKTKVMKSTSGCKVQIYGWYKASLAKRIWICEGEWDAIALSWILALNHSKDRAVGIPGAQTFKDEWVELFKDKDVVLCYDNDTAGDQGNSKAYEMLKEIAKSILIIKWPANLKSGYDIRDFVIDNKKSEVINRLKRILLAPEDHPLFEEKAEKKKIKLVSGRSPSFEETLAHYRKWADMESDLVDVLKIMFATVLSTKDSGEPLWIYIVGPAGSGKTMLLMSLDNNPFCVFRSSISSHALVSGFKRNVDPSLLPKFNKKCCVWKDFTELLSKKSFERDEIYSTLRGAYDGQVVRSFGNGIEREYYDLHFSMLAGVTPAIYGDRNAMLGERFLKIEIFKGVGKSADKQIAKALSKTSTENEEIIQLQKAANKFLNRKIYKPEIPEWVQKRLISLCQLISMLRAVADREEYGEKEIKYRPTHEIGTRLAKQLYKLVKYLAVVAGRKKVNEEDYALMERVAFDTSEKIHYEILEAIFIKGGKATAKEIVDHIGLSLSLVWRNLQDMTLVKVVDKIQEKGKGIGRPSVFWSVSTRIKELWKLAEIDRNIISKKIVIKKR